MTQAVKCLSGTPEEREAKYAKVAEQENGPQLVAALRYAERLLGAEAAVRSMAEIIGGGEEVAAGFSAMIARELASFNLDALFTTLLLLSNIAYRRGQQSVTRADTEGRE